MDPSHVYVVNSIFGWALVALSIVGYVLTARRMKEKWAGWIVLAVGWALFALAQTLYLSENVLGLHLLIGLWISSFVLVLTAILLLFLKLIRIRGGR